MLVLLLVILSFVSYVFSYPCIRYNFANEAGQSVANLKWAVYACGDEDCPFVDKTYWYETGKTRVYDYAEIKFRPDLPPSGKYLVHFFQDT